MIRKAQLPHSAMNELKKKLLKCCMLNPYTFHPKLLTFFNHNY